MQAFDFDGTIYDGDSTVDFFRYALRREPACWAALPGIAAAEASYALRSRSLEQFKGAFYGFLRRVRDIDGLVEGFWNSHWRKVKPEVAGLVQPGDVVASASPEFLLREPCRRLGAELIASQVDARTGALLGPNCRDHQKAARLREAGLEGRIEVFYTDSSADEPCVTMAQRGVLVRGRELSDYPMS